MINTIFLISHSEQEGNVPFQVYDHFRELNTGYELDKEKRLCQASKRENLSSGFPTS